MCVCVGSSWLVFDSPPAPRTVRPPPTVAAAPPRSGPWPRRGKPCSCRAPRRWRGRNSPASGRRGRASRAPTWPSRDASCRAAATPWPQTECRLPRTEQRRTAARQPPRVAHQTRPGRGGARRGAALLGGAGERRCMCMPWGVAGHRVWWGWEPLRLSLVHSWRGKVDRHGSGAPVRRRGVWKALRSASTYNASERMLGLRPPLTTPTT